MTKEQPKVHLIADESIGGVQREFIEVERKAEVGDYVYYLEDERLAKVVLDTVSNGDGLLNGSETYLTTALIYKSKVLAPTEIVHIDDIRYQLAERKAKLGEKVLVPTDTNYFEAGDVFEVVGTEFPFSAVGNADGNVLDGRYYVLIPVDSALAEPTPDIHDLLANLAQRVTSLERITGELVRAKSSVENKLGSIESQLRDTQNNVQTFAEQTEANTKDIKFLDDRTYEKPGKPTKSAEEILREISKILERDDRQ